MKWSAEQIEGMTQILKIQKELKISNLDLEAYDWIDYAKNDEDIAQFDADEASYLASEVYVECAGEDSKDYKLIVLANW